MIEQVGVVMINYGEVLVYWYLRLNGFFPITDFVLHDVHQREDRKDSGDCDLLAVRFPYSSEKINGKLLDCDHDLFRKLEWTADQPLSVALIVQVKTGEFKSKELKKSFSEDVLTYAIRRIGFVEESKIPSAIAQLEDNEILKIDDFLLAKLVVVGKKPRDVNRWPCILIDINHVDEWIRGRIKNYADVKRADRMFFPDPLIQYLAEMGE